MAGAGFGTFRRRVEIAQEPPSPPPELCFDLAQNQRLAVVRSVRRPDRLDGQPVKPGHPVLIAEVGDVVVPVAMTPLAGTVVANWWRVRGDSRGSSDEAPRCYGRRMIDIGSIASLHAHSHQLHAYCQRCDRWATLPLAEMIAAGQGARRLPFTVRCRWCGAVGRLQVRPLMPMHSTANRWMTPH